jgi:hypothetical protein
MKKFTVLSLFSLIFLYSCCVQSTLDSFEFFRLDVYKFDDGMKNIDSLIKKDGCFQLSCTCFSDQYYYKFFPSGEVISFLNHDNFDSIEFRHWGRYHIQNDTIKTQIYYYDDKYCKYSSDKTEQWFKVINDTTMIRFIICYKCFDDFYTGRTISDTLRFVKWEALEDTTKYNYILEQNWLRPLKKNWKEGYYPGDEE